MMDGSCFFVSWVNEKKKKTEYIKITRFLVQQCNKRN